MSKPPLGKLFLIIKSICNARNDHSTILKWYRSLLFVSCNTRKIRLKKYFQKYVNAQTKNRFEVQQKDIIRVMFGNLFFSSLVSKHINTFPQGNVVFLVYTSEIHLLCNSSFTMLTDEGKFKLGIWKHFHSLIA